MTTQEKAPVAGKAAVVMSNGKEIVFGKRKVLMNVKHDETGVTLHVAHSDGEFRSHFVPTEEVGKWAAYGLRAFAKAQNIENSVDFETKSLTWIDPLTHSTRAPSTGSVLPIEAALIQVTGKTLETVRAFLSGKSRKEVNALKADPRIAPIYAALQAELLAKKASKKVSEDAEAPADLLADLG